VEEPPPVSSIVRISCYHCLIYIWLFNSPCTLISVFICKFHFADIMKPIDILKSDPDIKASGNQIRSNNELQTHTSPCLIEERRERFPPDLFKIMAPSLKVGAAAGKEASFLYLPSNVRFGSHITRRGAGGIHGSCCRHHPLCTSGPLFAGHGRPMVCVWHQLLL